MTLAIETNALEYSIGRDFRVAGLDMHVPTGSVYGFLGPNGAGKTTTIRLLLGLLRPAGGRIMVLGSPMPEQYKSVLARTGYVPERPHVYPSLTVAEALMLHRAFHPTWDDVWAEELRRQFTLAPDRRVGALSKGESGKLLMLLALAQRPELLVLDEPTDGLDPVVRRDILASVLQYVTDRQATVLISSHLVHELERICDWVGLMDAGRLIAELPMQEFKSGLKRLRVVAAPDSLAGVPFTVLARERNPGSVEQWLVRGWAPGMHEYITSVGASVREVIDLDLEEGFVEMLRSSRDRVR
ncbi:MAG TPA: ABC transporter ATP-binding protein [Gemmatimonadaceae bacterium]|nr:ABC transporter ATP-binding protein [Gemmatimonadaceae bacterium]